MPLLQPTELCTLLCGLSKLVAVYRSVSMFSKDVTVVKVLYLSHIYVSLSHALLASLAVGEGHILTTWALNSEDARALFTLATSSLISSVGQRVERLCFDKTPAFIYWMVNGYLWNQ